MTRAIALEFVEDPDGDDGTMRISGDDTCAATPIVVALAVRITHDPDFLDDLMAWFEARAQEDLKALKESTGVPLYADSSDLIN